MVDKLDESIKRYFLKYIFYKYPLKESIIRIYYKNLL